MTNTYEINGHTVLDQVESVSAGVTTLPPRIELSGRLQLLAKRLIRIHEMVVASRAVRFATTISDVVTVDDEGAYDSIDESFWQGTVDDLHDLRALSESSNEISPEVADRIQSLIGEIAERVLVQYLHFQSHSNGNGLTERSGAPVRDACKEQRVMKDIPFTRVRREVKRKPLLAETLEEEDALPNAEKMRRKLVIDALSRKGVVSAPFPQMIENAVTTYSYFIKWHLKGISNDSHARAMIIAKNALRNFFANDYYPLVKKFLDDQINAVIAEAIADMPL